MYNNTAMQICIKSSHMSSHNCHRLITTGTLQLISADNRKCMIPSALAAARRGYIVAHAHTMVQAI